jgi:murein DD-endopeptidase MepM/ murein hydrolase activator NlpD
MMQVLRAFVILLIGFIAGILFSVALGPQYRYWLDSNFGKGKPLAQPRYENRPTVVGQDDDGGAGVLDGVSAGKKLPPDLRPKDFEADSIEDLRKKGLELPVAGMELDDVKDSFSEPRGARLHEAVDILAPRNTPVLAVEDGTIAKLFYSVPGGITIYQFDPTAIFAYYYAHLEKYAEHLKEGDQINKGQVIGYVGSSGNAPSNTPHLHFAIFRLTDEKHWWEGSPVDPYKVLKED